MDQKTLKTPITNRGVDNTFKSHFCLDIKGQTNDLEEFILFDWFQATILDLNLEILSDTGELIGVTDYKKIAYDLFRELFGIGASDLVFEYKGINGYNARLEYKNIYIMWHTTEVRMGIHILMSGQGCRDFEQLGLDYFEFINKLSKYRVNYNRIDISIDDFTGKYFTMSRIIDYCRHGMVVSPFIHCFNMEKLRLKDGVNEGHTVQFGSKASQIQVTFYDKLKERASKNIIVHHDIKFWTRCEVRFRHDRADELISMIKQNHCLNETIKGVLYKYLDFKTKNSNDSNISRRTTVRWWSEFLEGIDKLDFSKLLPEHSITKKMNWLHNSTAKSNVMVIMANMNLITPDNKSVDFVLENLQKGTDLLTNKDLQIINDYRRSIGLIPCTFGEIKDMVHEVKSVLFVTNNDYLD